MHVLFIIIKEAEKGTMPLLGLSCEVEKGTAKRKSGSGALSVRERVHFKH